MICGGEMLLVRARRDLTSAYTRKGLGPSFLCLRVPMKPTLRLLLLQAASQPEVSSYPAVCHHCDIRIV